MENENQNRRRTKKPRQEWNPHWLLKLLYVLASTALSALKIAICAAATVLMIVLVCGVVFVGTLGDYLQEDILPEAADWSLDDYVLEETSFMYYVDEDGNIQQLQQIYTTVDRQWATLDEIPQALIDATVAIEDKRFYEHQGVDWITTVKACLNMFFGGDSQFGGSTITQQLIKNSTGEKSVTVQRKVMEIFRAQICERDYDKDVIMEQYLNRIYLGRGCWGVKSAAAEYFGKELQSLTPAECAALISITNNPSLFNPYSESVYKYKGEERDGAGRNRYRQMNVLNEMLNQGFLTQAEYDEAVAQEMVFKSGISDDDKWTVCENEACGYEGIRSEFTSQGGSWFCPECGTQATVSIDASQHIYSWFVDAVLIDVATELAAQDDKVWEELDIPTQNLYLERIQKGGYHIYTTMDMKVQQALDSVYTDLSKIPTTRSQQQLQSAMVIIDNDTGDVVALSGGVGEKKDFLAYNKATQAKLQTGSSQKPLSVYAPAFEAGVISPATVIKDMPVSYTGGPWPKNDNRRYNYARTVYSGIVSSVNAISVRTLQLIGYEYGFSFAKYNFGQNSLTEDYPLANGQSLNDLGAAPLALGALTVGATVREMSAAYATFPNGGTYREPRLFTKVYNSDGELVIDNVQDSRTILSEKTANYMNYCLYNAATHGTGAAATMPGQNIAGKTGTTSSNRDRWFCGYTSHYTAAVWCGYNKPEQIYLTGNTANPAARLWRMVMMPVHEGLPNEGLFNGNAFRSVGVCLDSGKLATAACKSDVRGDRVSYANCYPEDIPSGTCSKHVSVEYCVTGGGVATEYCSMFADVEIASRSLVKLTQAEVNEIRNAISAGLVDIYYDDGYVYYLGSGDGEAWHGFRDDYPDNDRPYLLCPTHTKEAWEEYQAEQEATEGTGPDDGMWGDGEGEGGSGNEGGNAGSDDDDMWA
ncbi:MAG: transglycosylase domain-containing protein [Oscillospiraceae bacterium]|nr:transglycosylase domain-containing protein [Oscillospiraceae bacterium]